MDKRHDAQELIDRYVAGELSPDEMAAFEEHMRRDETLTREMLLSRHIVMALERKGEKDALQALEGIGSADELMRLMDRAERGRRGSFSRKRLKGRWIFAASAAVIALAVVIVGLQPRYSAQELYARWYETPVYDPVVSRGGEEIAQNQKELLDKAGALYESGEFSQAVTAYEHAAAMAPVPDAAVFYWAAALVQTGNTDEAIAKFTSLAADERCEYAAQAAWQLVLNYLRKGERKEARRILEQIAGSGDPYAADARMLLDELSSKKLF